MNAYARPDNPLLVPEIGNAREFARYFYEALGRGAIGFAPFGMDGTGFFNYPLGPRRWMRQHSTRSPDPMPLSAA